MLERFPGKRLTIIVRIIFCNTLTPMARLPTACRFGRFMLDCRFRNAAAAARSADLVFRHRGSRRASYTRGMYRRKRPSGSSSNKYWLRQHRTTSFRQHRLFSH
jgi:hypothetical protein